MRSFLSLSVAALVIAFALPVRAATYEINASDDLLARLSSLAPGDEVIVHEGTWDTGGFYEVTWAGTAAMPILIRAADGEHPHIQGVRAENVINVMGSYATLRGFEISGGSHGIRFGSVDHVSLEDNVLHDLGDVGVSCNRPGNLCDHLTVSGNEIYDTGADGGPGEGMYIGCNDAACTVSNSIFRGNYIHDIGGTQGDGIEIKTGSFGNVVSDNVIIGANYPAITMYGFADGLGERNVVERNFVWGTNDNGIQVVGQVIVRNNIILDAGANGIQSKASQGFSPHDVDIFHNTIFRAGSACLKTNDWSGQSGQRVANNAVYCDGGLAVDINGGAPAAMFAGNLALGEVRAPGGFAAATGVSDLGAPGSDPPVLYPPAGSPLVNAGDAAFAVPGDFDGTARTDGMPDVGAYERTGASPAWILDRGFKGSAPAPGVDGGVPGLDAGTAPGIDGGAIPGVDGGVTPRADGGPGTTEDGGCGCRAAGSRTAPALPRFGFAWILVGILVGVARRRRSRRLAGPRAAP